eukprot:157038_1
MTPKNKNKNNNQNKNNNENKNDDDDNDDDDDAYLNSAKECKYNLIDIHQTNENNIEGIGSVLWFLCKIFLSNSALAPLPALPPLNMNNNNNNNNNNNDISMDDKINNKIHNKLSHVPLSQRLLIEEIVTKLYTLKIKQLMNVMIPLWPQPQAMERSFSALSDRGNNNGNNKKEKPKLTIEEKRKKKRALKAQKKMLKKMRKNSEKFVLAHSQSIINDEMEEALEEKEKSESFGIGINNHCIVCKSKEGQNTMFMMGFVKKCSLLYRCIDNKYEINNNNLEIENEKYLSTRKGMNFTFCGHFVHKQCYDTFIINKVRSHYRHEHYYGRGTLSISHFEYACPYCKTIGNIVVPIRKIYRNPNLYHHKFDNIKHIENDKKNGINIIDIQKEISENYEIVFNTLLSRTSSTEYFTKLLWIYDDYKHDSHSDILYLKNLEFI